MESVHNETDNADDSRGVSSKVGCNLLDKSASAIDDIANEKSHPADTEAAQLMKSGSTRNEDNKEQTSTEEIDPETSTSTFRNMFSSMLGSVTNKIAVSLGLYNSPPATSVEASTSDVTDASGNDFAAAATEVITDASTNASADYFTVNTVNTKDTDTKDDCRVDNLSHEEIISRPEKKHLEAEKPIINLDRANTLVLSGLGRPFKLGMLYDCRKDQLVPEASLWDESSLQTAFSQTPKPNSDYDVIAEDSLSTKLQSLGVEPNLSLSVLSGLVSVPEVENYLNDRKSSKNARATLKYGTTSHFEEIQMEKLDVSSIQYSELLSQATHIVTGILYGAEAFFVFDREVDQKESYDTIHDDMKSLINLIPGMCGTKGRANAKIRSRDEPEINRFQCRFYCDVSIGKNPTTFQDAVEVCKEFPQLFAEDSKNFVPKKICLFPLNQLNSNAPRLVKEISTDLAVQIQHEIDSLYTMEIKCSELINSKMCSVCVPFQGQLSDFIEMIKEFRNDFIGQLAGLLPEIRDGSSEKIKLSELLQNIQQSPFNRKYLSIWLNNKEEEIKVLSQYYDAMDKTPGVQFAFVLGDHDTAVNDLQYSQVVSFEFKVFNKSDTFLQSMKVFLREQIVTLDCIVVTNQWFKNKTVIQDMRLKVKQFTSFVESNKDNKKTKFIVSDSSEDTNTYNGTGAVILLYENGSSAEFEPPGQPGKPIITVVTHEFVQLGWEQPEYGNNSIQRYSILYQSIQESQEWKTEETNATERFIVIKYLAPETKYVFQVRAECISGSGETSIPSEIIETKPSPVDTPLKKIIAESNILDEGPPVIYKLQFKQVLAFNNVVKMEFGIITHPPKPNRVLMVVGATGAGKSTLINGIVNYILGVEWEHEFRFKLIADEVNKSQAHSQTQAITAYTFYWHKGSPLNYTLTVIDTPGFGDTRGLERDQQITDDIREFFSIEGEDGIDVLDGIGFVTQASLARLTPTQKYISDSILSIFGKDIKNNIFIMTTFADGAKPPVMGAVKEAGIPYAEFFRFNNSALFENSSDSEFAKMFWQMGYSSFEKFFIHFGKAGTVSLKMTRQVLEERQMLQTIIQGIQPQINAGLSKIDELQQEEQILKNRESEILANKDFTYQIKVTKQNKIDCPRGRYVTNCATCHFTCHPSCAYEDDRDKWRCSAMSGDESNAECVVCPGNCSWRKHFNNGYHFELYEEMETRTSKELRERYNEAKSKKNNVEGMITKIEKELNEMYQGVLHNIRRARKCLQRLDDIALKPNPLTEVEYIDLLIRSEEQQKNPGWRHRVDYFYQVRQQAEILSRMTDQEAVNEMTEENSRTLWKRFTNYIKGK